jgi:glycosyltransferase involved in cell wall biosynthesis
MNSKISVIVPTLNEGKNIPNLLNSLENQTLKDFEVVVVDGGSSDKTIALAEAYHSNIVVERGLAEYPSRNHGAKIANGDILLFTCADVVFPRGLLAKIAKSFQDPELVAMTGPDWPTDSTVAMVEYGVYNFARFLFSSFPKPAKRFSTSTNFLAVRKAAFEKTGGFVRDINSDGYVGKQLSEIGKVKFSNSAPVLISPRRFHQMGFFKFNLHYLYVLENFFPFLSETAFFKSLKENSGAVHRDMHVTN